MNKIAIVGGDRREEILLELLVEKGYIVNVLRNPTGEEKPGINNCPDIASVLDGVGIIIAPMSGTDREGYLKSAFVDYRIKLDQGFFNLMDADGIFVIGTAQPVVKNILSAKGIKYIELTTLDELAIRNAIPTAEGALKIAIEETEFTIADSQTLVLGLGRVGLTMAWRLRMLGAESYAVTRDRAARARGRDLGIKLLTYKNLADYLPEMDILFNTVPALILDREYVALLKKQALIIDLASAPGGTDFDAARERGIKALLASGLPSKVAPLTAAKIIADIIPELCS